jgi:DNA-binding winged helix-turn-helix (wHTH) protein
MLRGVAQGLRGPMTHFPPFSFDPHDRTLWRDAIEVPLTPKASSLLACLLRARGALVSKDQILAAVWPDTHVQPDNVKVLIREIRQALGDSPIAPVYVRSLARRGYAFVAPTTDHSRPAGDGLLTSKQRVLIPRRSELSALNRALYASGSSAKPLVLVNGGYGVGKTTLCNTFLRAIRTSGAARACYGQCFDRESAQEPYYPILDALLRLDRDHPDLVPRALAEHAPNWLSLFPQWRPLARAGAPARPTMLEQLRLAIGALARERPLAIVIDDLQWADADTIRALAHLGGAGTGARAVIVATSSEGAWSAGVRARSSLCPGARGCTSLTLQPFSVRQVVHYVVARFGRGPLEALAPIVHSATGGNAQMMTAAFDGLVERRLIVGGATGWRRESSTEAIGWVLAETWSDLVGRQLEQLDTHEREAIEAAAAVGFEFALGPIAMLLGKRTEEVRTILGPLARRGQLIVAAEGADAARHHGSFRFRHRGYVEAIARKASPLRQRAFERRIRVLRESAARVAT